MAVYTDLSDDELTDFVALYDVGALLSCKGIAEGLTNTNYLLVTASGPLILTLYEKRVEESDLPFFLALMEHWSARGIVCPRGVAGRDGVTLRHLKGRPAAVFTFLNGMPVRRPTRAQCTAMGAMTARLHLASADFTPTRANRLSLAGCRALFDLSRARADEVMPGLADAIARELDYLEARWPTDLPRGAIHCDLSLENVFFQGETLSGVIDFNYACTEIFTYELMFAMNDWCFEPDGQFNLTKAQSLLAAYQAGRRLSPGEIAALPLLARGATMPYMLTRLYDWLNPEPGALVTRRNPLDFYEKLKFHQGVKSAAEYGLFQ